MAKSARASVIKKNNQRLKANVFGPVEQARAERLSAKLLELAKAPKPEREADTKMDVENDDDGEFPAIFQGNSMRQKVSKLTFQKRKSTVTMRRRRPRRMTPVS